MPLCLDTETSNNPQILGIYQLRHQNIIGRYEPVSVITNTIIYCLVLDTETSNYPKIHSIYRSRHQNIGLFWYIDRETQILGRLYKNSHFSSFLIIYSVSPLPNTILVLPYISLPTPSKLSKAPFFFFLQICICFQFLLKILLWMCFILIDLHILMIDLLIGGFRNGVFYFVFVLKSCSSLQTYSDIYI